MEAENNSLMVRIKTMDNSVTEVEVDLDWEVIQLKKVIEEVKTKVESTMEITGNLEAENECPSR